MIRNLLFILVISIFCFEAQAKMCRPTPQYWSKTAPDHFHKSNNLRRVEGTVTSADGVKIILEGHIYDINCTPVTDAVVEIWQANSYGGFDYNRKPFDNIKRDLNFVGTGKTVTNNLGYYNFFTIFPGSIAGNRAPHINIKVIHKNFVPFESIIYFDDNPKNDTDILLNSSSFKEHKNLLITQPYSLDKALETNELLYSFDIVLNHKNLYVHY